MERLRSKKAELEAESRTLEETQKNVERQLNFLEEKIAIEELDSNNRAARSCIVQLASRIIILENELEQASEERTSTATEKEPIELSVNFISPDETEILKQHSKKL